MNIIEIRVASRFKLSGKIGAGTFCDIYQGVNVHSGAEVAIKFEDTKSKYPQLLYEAKILQNLQGGSCIPNMHWCGPENEFNVLVIDLLGPNLEDLLNKCDRKFSLKTVLMITDQLLSNMEYIHSKNYIHRDIKPENFLFGLGKQSHVLYTIDFGLSKRFRDAKTQEHIPYREKKPLIGTARYASINAHKGIEQSRRDDMESIGYLMIYLLKGNLPWQGIKAKNKDEKYLKIKEQKINIPLKELCHNLPHEFSNYINYCRNLNFDEKPNYRLVKRWFKELLYREGHEVDNVYDWILIPLKNSNPTVYSCLPLTFDFDEEENEKYLTNLKLAENLKTLKIDVDMQPKEEIKNQDENYKIMEQNTKMILSQRHKFTARGENETNRRTFTEPNPKKNQIKKDKECFIF